MPKNQQQSKAWVTTGAKIEGVAGNWQGNRKSAGPLLGIDDCLHDNLLIDNISLSCYIALISV
jgi:hypothetical protein